MKKTISLLVILSLLLSVVAPMTTFAAEPKKTIAQRFAAIEETYGIGMVVSQGQAMPGVLLEKPNAQYEDAILTNLETALAMVGPSFTKSINKAVIDRKEAQNDGGVLTNYQGKDFRGLGIGILTYEHATDYTSYMNYGIMLSGKTVSVDSILRILAFAFLDNNVGITDKPRGNFAGQKYGKFQTAPAGFLSTWAAQSWTNDYCSVFAYMVRNNKNNKLTPNTVLWNKGKTVYDDLEKYTKGSRAVQRAAANLGIEIKKK